MMKNIVVYWKKKWITDSLYLGKDWIEINKAVFDTFKDVDLFISNLHHCRLCGSQINNYKEYDLYYLVCFIEQKYLENLPKYERI